MLVSCKHCGGVHTRGAVCTKKAPIIRRKKEASYITAFRGSRAWKTKREHIKTRDKFLCQICLLERYFTTRKYNFHQLEVHHIQPINERWTERLADYNLITLCSMHHKMAENGSIPRAELLEIVKNA
jgi:5-methylcytosine-specific restriction endonuclease McrA